jgi:hypothetical protein
VVIAMTRMNYQTVFEIGLSSFPWGGVAHPLSFVGIGLLLCLFARSKKVYLLIGVSMASLASIFSLILLVIAVPNFIKLRSAYTSGKSSIIEGVVENFRPAPTIGPASESFSVRGVILSYNALEATPCFHNAPLHAGPIRDGLGVRIRYYEGCIERVDILQNPGLAQ